MPSIAHLRAKIILNCQLSFINFENFIIAMSVMKRGDFSEHTAYVIAGPQRATVARASGSSAEEALKNLAHITSF
ncbi:hypothetical protein QM012_009342 [Aureobasidium pullulans]|uniref:Uncharacterized protein n=1 Tax=Aureobasidium pullulans TaxID=5580 RepID=A0ABR0TGJ3_AURPU